jgi:hypothetical protein
MAAEVDTDAGTEDDGGCFKQGCGLSLGLVGLIVGYIFVTSFSSVLYSLGALLVGALAGVILKATTSPSGTTERRMRTAGYTGLGLGAAALVTSLVLMLPFGGAGGSGFPDRERVSNTGGTVGPITIDQATWVDVQVQQDIESPADRVYERWSFVTVELLDEEKQYLSSFGGGFWNYAGYDDGYYWDQEDDFYEATLWMPPGTYYVRLETEANVDAAELEPILVTMDPAQWWGNPRPLQWLAYVALFLGAALFVASIVEASSGASEEEGFDDIEEDWGEEDAF